MENSIVHIGYQKTATTWFQKRYYPLVENATYIKRPRVRQAFLNPSALQFNPRQARQALDVAGGSPVIVCEEDMCGHYKTAGLLGCMSKDVAYRVQDTLPDAHIVIFIRSQPAMIPAIYLQYIRGGGTLSAQRFLFPYKYDRRYNKKRFRKPMFLFDHFDYQYLIRHYRRLFGADRVHVFPYEAFQSNQAEFIAEYGRRLGLEIPFERINFAPNNRQYRSGTLRVAKVLNRFAAGDALYRTSWISLMPMKVRKVLLEIWNRGPLNGDKFTPEQLLGPKIVDYIYNRFADSNRQLASELNLPLADYGYPMAVEGIYRLQQGNASKLEKATDFP